MGKYGGHVLSANLDLTKYTIWQYGTKIGAEVFRANGRDSQVEVDRVR